MKEHDIDDQGMGPGGDPSADPSDAGQAFCPECRGIGVTAEGDVCPTCGGTGRLIEGATGV